MLLTWLEILLLFTQLGRLSVGQEKQQLDSSASSGQPVVNSGRNIDRTSILFPWPGQDNKLPYISQWGPWSEQQIHRGEGQTPFQPPGIQINPHQAQWFPNSPEYHGFDAKYIATLKRMEDSGQKVGGNAGNVIFFPTTSTTTGLPETAWSTWTGISNEGKEGVLRQWSNWYIRPDIAGQQQETKNIRQSMRGRLPDGKLLPITNETYLEDTNRILVDILAGFVAGSTPKKAAMYNMKTYYPQYRRDYWIGKRFFSLDPQTTLESYTTCTFTLPVDVVILYEIDDTRVEEILFQCVKYQETCCKLNCCDSEGRPLYYRTLVRSQASIKLSVPQVIFCNYVLYLSVLLIFIR